jgi:hypothetical protein
VLRTGQPPRDRRVFRETAQHVDDGEEAFERLLFTLERRLEPLSHSPRRVVEGFED